MQKSIFLRKQNLTHFLSICDINHWPKMPVNLKKEDNGSLLSEILCPENISHKEILMKGHEPATH